MILVGRYSGSDIRRETGRNWQDEAEGQLRQVVKKQGERIAGLEKEVAMLKRRVKALEKHTSILSDSNTNITQERV